MPEPRLASLNTPDFHFSPDALGRTVLIYGKQDTEEGNEITFMVVRCDCGAIQPLYEDSYDPSLPVMTELADLHPLV